MNYNTLMTQLQNLINRDIPQSELCKILNLKSSTMSNRQQRNSAFKDVEISLLEKHYNVILSENSSGVVIGDRVEITYWDQLPKDLYNPKIASVWFDREIIENDWKISPENLCIIPMIGDKMTNYWYPIRNNDILMIDTSHNYIMGNGVYFATSRNNTRFWIREMQILLDQTLEINGFAPSGNTRKIFTAPDLQQADFKIIGKVIKNVSFRL